jgi:hypothetical protein
VTNSAVNFRSEKDGTAKKHPERGIELSYPPVATTSNSLRIGSNDPFISGLIVKQFLAVSCNHPWKLAKKLLDKVALVR